MTRRTRFALPLCPSAAVSLVGAAVAALLGVAASSSSAWAAEPNFPISGSQRSTAQKVAQDGIPLAELAPDAPDSHTVVKGDTLWDISKLFLKSPWRWPELWGMNIQEIRNPHLIYPGQILYLDKSGGRARLRTAMPVGGGSGGDVKLSPRARSSELDNSAIASIPFHLIEPFLNEAIVMEKDDLDKAPRIVATQEERVILARNDTAYVRGDLGKDTAYRIFRQARPLTDPGTKEILGYEAVYVGSAEYTRPGETRTAPNGKEVVVPASFRITSIRQEAYRGDRLAPVAAREFTNYAPHAPASPVDGQIISIYGDALTAGQNQIVTLNRGARDGMERGHVLALWHSGTTMIDKTDRSKPMMQLPDERHGMLFVFRVFDRVSYALILSVNQPVNAGDRFTQP